MIDVGEWSWVVNINDMTCKNLENGVTIKMEMVGDNLKGKLLDMPMKLFAEVSKYSDGEKIIEKIIRLAEDEYMSSKPSL